MSKYTTELRYLIESGFDIGLKDYPIYKEDHREELNKKIIEHFYFREIGLETPELFKRFLNRKMNEIMPYYNQRYKSCDTEFNPLFNIDLTEEFERKVEGNAKDNSNINQSTITEDNNTVNDEEIVVNSDTPQSNLTNNDIKANKYASETSYNTNNSNTSNNGSIKNENKVENTSENNQKEIYTKKTIGSSAGLSFSNAIKQWRKIMVNIDMEIIEELEELFIQLW